MNILKATLVVMCCVLSGVIFLFLFGSLPQILNYELSDLYAAILMPLAYLVKIPVIVFFRRKFRIDLTLNQGLLSVNFVLLLFLLSIIIFSLVPLIISPVSFVKSLFQTDLMASVPHFEICTIDSFIAFINLVFIGPCIEEVIHRGIAYNVLRRSYPVWFSIIFSSLLFALVHLSLDRFLLFFIYGVLFSFVYEKTNNLFVPILFHIFINFLSKATIISAINLNSIDALIYLSVVIVCIIGVMLLIKNIIRKYQSKLI